MNLPTHLTAVWRLGIPGRLRCRLGRFGAFVAAFVLLPLVPQARGADFSVTAPGFFYSFSTPSGPIAGQNPTITVVRGETYTFAINTSSSHPFRINSTGVSNNATFSGTITWKVPLAESNYTYRCTLHPFGGNIITVPVRVARFTVGTNLVLRTTAPSNYSVFPEFKTTMAGSNWLALTVQTNRFLLGTNETICGLPSGSNVIIRVKAVRR
jgi:hypothetical protein